MECILSDPLLMDLRRTPALKNNELGTTDDTARVRISKLDAEVGEMREGATHRGGPIFEKRREGGATSTTQKGLFCFIPTITNNGIEKAQRNSRPGD